MNLQPMKDLQGAITDFTKSINLKAGLNTYYSRALIEFEISDYKSAIVDFDKVIEINAGSAKAYFFRGLAKLNLNQ